MPEQPFLTIFFKKQCFKKSHLNTNEEGSGFRWTPTPSFSGKWGIRKLNQTDGEKGLLKWGIYIGATPYKNLANIKKTTEIYRLGSNRSPLSSQRVKKLFNQYSTEPWYLKIFKRESLVSNTNDATLKAILKHRNHPSIITIQNKCKDKVS